MLGAVLLLINLALPGFVAYAKEAPAEGDSDPVVECPEGSSEEQWENDVAEMNGCYYPSLADAIDAAEDGDEILLLKDDRVSFTHSNTEENNNIMIRTWIVINWGWNTIYWDKDFIVWWGEEKPYHMLYVGWTDSDVTIENLTIAEFANESDRLSNNVHPIVVGSSFWWKITLSGVTIQDFHRHAMNIGGGEFEINNCRIIGSDYSNTNEAFQQWIEIYGTASGTINNTTISGISKSTAEDGQGRDGYAIVANFEGNLEVTDTTVESNSQGIYVGWWMVKLWWENTNFSATDGVFAIEEGADFEINGGTYSEEPNEEYLAEWYFAEDNENGTWTVKPIVEISEIAISGIVKPVAWATSTTDINITTTGVNLEYACWSAVTTEPAEWDNEEGEGAWEGEGGAWQGEDGYGYGYGYGWEGEGAWQGEESEVPAEGTVWPQACEGDDCNDEPIECEGDDCDDEGGEEPAECEGDDCDDEGGEEPAECEGDDCDDEGGEEPAECQAITFEEGKEYVLNIEYSLDNWYILAEDFTINESAKADKDPGIDDNEVSLFYTATAKPSSNNKSSWWGGGSSKKSSKNNTWDTVKGNSNNTNTDGTIAGSDSNATDGQGNSKSPVITNEDIEKYGQEQIDAYKWAYENGITTMGSVGAARLDQPLTRAELAKMMVVYVAKILKKSTVVKETVTYNDVNESLGDLAGYIVLAYQYQIMWINADGTQLKYFNPNGEVTRWEYATVFSRVLFGSAFNQEWEEFYARHIEALKTAGILKDTNPTMKELRGWVMLMMYRSSLNAEEIEKIIKELGATENEAAKAKAKSTTEEAAAMEETIKAEQEATQEATEEKAETTEAATTVENAEATEATATEEKTDAEAKTWDVAEAPAETTGN